MLSLSVRCALAVMLVTGLTACGGASGPADVAAKACIEWAQGQMAGKPLGADAAALAASAPTDITTTEFTLSAPVKVNAGLADEQTQTLECRVRIAPDGSSAEVVQARFIW